MGQGLGGLREHFAMHREELVGPQMSGGLRLRTPTLKDISDLFPNSDPSHTCLAKGIPVIRMTPTETFLIFPNRKPFARWAREALHVPCDCGSIVWAPQRCSSLSLPRPAPEQRDQDLVFLCPVNSLDHCALTSLLGSHSPFMAYFHSGSLAGPLCCLVPIHSPSTAPHSMY